MSKYFAPSEFRACNPPCIERDMDAAFLALLDKVREVAGIPLVLTSAYRSFMWEKAHGRKGTSSHTKGLAVDIRCNTSRNRYLIVAAALACGITRIGVAKTYIHLDADTSKDQRVIWHYYD